MPSSHPLPIADHRIDGVNGQIKLLQGAMGGVLGVDLRSSRATSDVEGRDVDGVNGESIERYFLWLRAAMFNRQSSEHQYWFRISLNRLVEAPWTHRARTESAGLSGLVKNNRMLT